MHKHVHCLIFCRELDIDNARNEQYKIDIYTWNFIWTFIFQFQLDIVEQQIC
jgi:plasmid rolling circle replication initiator protein Rep